MSGLSVVLFSSTVTWVLHAISPRVSIYINVIHRIEEKLTVCEESVHLTGQRLRVRDLSEDALDGGSGSGDEGGTGVNGSKGRVSSRDGCRLSVYLNSCG